MKTRAVRVICILCILIALLFSCKTKVQAYDITANRLERMARLEAKSIGYKSIKIVSEGKATKKLIKKSAKHKRLVAERIYGKVVATAVMKTRNGNFYENKSLKNLKKGTKVWLVVLYNAKGKMHRLYIGD